MFLTHFGDLAFLLLHRKEERCLAVFFHLRCFRNTYRMVMFCSQQFWVEQCIARSYSATILIFSTQLLVLLQNISAQVSRYILVLRGCRMLFRNIISVTRRSSMR